MKPAQEDVRALTAWDRVVSWDYLGHLEYGQISVAFPFCRPDLLMGTEDAFRRLPGFGVQLVGTVVRSGESPTRGVTPSVDDSYY